VQPDSGWCSIRLQVAGCRLWGAGRLWVVGCGLWVVGHGSWVVGGGLQVGLQVADCVTNYFTSTTFSPIVG
jgi:hypothetical protein